MNRRIATGLSVVTMLAGGVLIDGISIRETSAQKMYRCGNQYQDHPCDEGGKEVGGKARRMPVTSTPTTTYSTAGAALASATCPQRGEAAEKIVYAREGGQTEEKSLAGERDPGRRKLVKDVYRTRGTVAEVRARIEAECRLEMEENAKAQALREALARTDPNGTRQPADGADGVSGDRSGAGTGGDANADKQREAAAKKASCSRVLESLDSVRAQQRSGGSTSTMEYLNRQRSRLENEAHKLGC